MKRNKFSLSHNVMQTMNMGLLNPIGVVEVNPGDTFQHAVQSLLRLAPLNTPVMHPTHAQIYHFFVPYRLIWDEFEDFITRGPDGDSAPVFPTIEFDAVAAGSLANLLGLPVFSTEAENVGVSALPFRAYALIYNEYFRDQDLIDPIGLDVTSGADTTTNTTLRTAAWQKDYFTSARPWTQKGPEVTIPLTDDAVDVTRKNNAGVHQIFQSGTNTTVATVTGANFQVAGSSLNNGGTNLTINPNGAWEVDLSQVAGVDVNDLRAALALQRFEEARARWGSRYVEYLRYLGVKSSDARLQRPEYLGGGSNTIQYSEVLQTSPESGEGVGNLYGHGIGAVSSNRYRRFFEEHGMVLSFMIVRPVAIYANGLFRMWNRRTFLDFWQPEMEHIGQQQVLNKEVYVGAASPDGVFGYQDKYDDFRRLPSRIAGEFATTLDEWTQARIFSSEPALNADFVNCVPDPRIFQSTDTDQLYCMIRHSIQARRLLAKTGSSFIF